MKWYSVKKYRPYPTDNTCIVLTEGGGIYIADAVHMAGDNISWEPHFMGDNSLSNVTHFCIPDPIEIEE